MRTTLSTFVLLVITLVLGCSGQNPQSWDYGIVVHGGAGRITRDRVDAEKEQLYRAKLEQVIRHGNGILASGGASLDAVEAVIVMLEDSPLFNAGKGAVFSAEGKNELDASIMDGRTRDSGAVAGITGVKNPIHLARLVMEESPHVMMATGGAENFAEEQGVAMETKEYFYTEQKWKDLQERRNEVDKHGTVGCVALDMFGNLSAGTSTGGMTFKRYGRVGDSPIIGAGTYADNSTCAVSCTGHGEFFIRFVVAYDISALMKYRGFSLNEAASSVINGTLVEAGGRGGAIAIDRMGNISMPFNTEGMYRGFMRSGEEPTVEMFGP